jgi:virginiamycin B lyase
MSNRSLVVCLAISLVTTVAARAQGRQGAAVQLPDGTGKDVVEATCARCHGLNQIVNSGGYAADGWQRLIGSMVALPAEQAGVVSAYLGEHFPERPRPEAVLVPGAVTVSIREWLVPTLGSRPHDPLATDDGAIWWTGQWANVLGRLDPATGAMKEYPLETPESGPHGLVADRAGNIWYTGVSKAHVGRLDPTTGDVTEYPLPEGARGPHTPIFDQRGVLWFTLQSGMVGRLVP